VSNDKLDRTIAKLRAEYADELPGTLSQMEELWRGICSAEEPPSQLAQLARMAHTITGSGTTFGFPGVTAAARELELFLDQCGGGKLPSPAQQAAVSALLAALRQSAVKR
jgi:multidomain signaling protein FimX